MLYVWKLFSIFAVIALLFLLAPAAVLLGPLEGVALPGGSAAVLAQPSSWPNDTQWTHPSNCYCDPPEDEYPTWLDLIGNDTIGLAVYYYFGADYAFFRERVRSNPSGTDKFAQDAWVVLFDLPEPGDYEYLLSIDGKDETVEFWNNTVKGSLIWNPILKDPAENIVWTNSTATYARIVDDGTGHYFVDWAIPSSVLDSYNVTANTKIYFCTSADANNFNKDYLDCYLCEPPTANFTADATSGCAPLTVNFTDLSTGSPTSWSWDFGDSNTSTDQNPIHQYSTAGNYTVSLNVTNACGSGNMTKINYITVKAAPVANFSANNTNPCVNTPILFTDSSTGNPTSWSWDFGDSNTSTDQNPIHQYSTAGNYTVSLNVTNACGSDTMTKPNYITVTAPINRYNLTVSSTSGGSVTTPGEGTYTYNASQVVNLVATADANYHFVNWTGNVGTIGNVTSATTNITMNGNYTIVANFAIKTYTITATAGANGNISPSGAVSVNCGANQTFNITADSCYNIANVSVDGSPVGAVASYTFTNVTANHTISATFSAITCTLTVNVTPSGGGNVTVNGATPSGYPNTTTWNCGENVTLNAVAAGGYSFVNWSGDLGGSVNPTNITMTSIKDVTAHFSAVIYNLTVISDGCCPINVSGAVSGTVPAGGNKTFTGIGEGGEVTVSVDDSAGCCKFDSWSDAGAQTHTITMNSDKSVTAYCSVPSYDLTVNVSPGGGGNVTVNGTTPTGYPNTSTWNNGDVVTLNATAASGYHFVNWTGNLTGSTNPTNITMNSDKNVTANFVINRYNLNISSTSGGNVTTPGEGTYTYNASEVVDLVATVDANYHFVNWTGDVGTVADVNSANTNITMTGNYSIVANFTVHPPIICVSPSSLNLTVAPNTTVTTTYTITNCGGGTLHWDSSNVTYVPDGNMTWLTQNITNGTLNASESDTVLVTVNTTGLAKGTYRAFITITGSTFIFPIIVVITTDIDVMRNLPGNALMPNETYPGDTFDVYVNFTAMMNDFNAIGLTDVAPDGWTVQVDKNWTYPTAYSVEARGNKVEILWSGPFSNGTNFTAMYKVTVPETAKPGINLFPENDGSKAWLGYYFGEDGPYTSNVTGDYEMVITVPSDIVGETRDVNANLLPDVDVTLLKQGEGAVISDVSTPNYSDAAYRTGQYWLRATRVRYYEINITNMTMLPDYYINLTTPELLAPGYVFDFEGNYGLVPRACDMSYALKSVNLWLVPPVDHPEWGIDEWKAMDSIHSWQYPS